MGRINGIRRRCAGAILLAGVMLLAACNADEVRVLFDGNYYPTRQKAVDKADRATFEVRVRRANQGAEGAMAAGQYGGVRYCIETFGTSEITWLSSTDPATVDASRNDLVLRGRCITW